MARNVFYRVNDPAVKSFLLPGQPMDKDIHNTALATRQHARDRINNRTGTLARNIQVNRPSITGAYKNTALVFTRTKYALYVHEGTTGPIFPGGKYLTVPKNHETSKLSGGALRKMWRSKSGRAELVESHGISGLPFFLAKSVAGQDANPYLKRGMEEAVARIWRR